MVGFLLNALGVILLLVGAGLCVWRSYLHFVAKPEPGPKPAASASIIAAGLVLACAGLYLWGSLIYVDGSKVGHLKRNIGGAPMEKGQILAQQNENGPQARILAPGLQMVSFVNFTHDIEYLDVESIPQGKCGMLKAKAGKPLGDRAFAEAFRAEEHEKMITDANYFLEKGGTKGPQTSVLTPGDHRINKYLWDVTEIDATVIPEGFVGVVTSHVYGPVNFGPRFQYDAPTGEQTEPIVVGGGEDGSLQVTLVNPGNVGIWNVALPQGTYYINTQAYKVTQVPIRAQKWEYSGGYTSRWIDLKVEENGQIVQEAGSAEVPVPEGAADRAIFAIVEGHNVAQELRVIVQVTEENAPFVVAAVGEDLQQVENKILTPIIREIVRTVIMSGQITVPKTKIEHVPVVDDGKPVVNAEGKAVYEDREVPVTDEDGEPVMVTRPIEVTDLINNRSAVLEVLEERIRPEGTKARVTIKEIRLAESSIPPEVTLPLRMRQLAQQLQASYLQMELAQRQRIESEKARAEADEQGRLIEAEIDVQRAEKLKQAREYEGEGEKAKLVAISEGQKAQQEVLGEERVVELAKFEQVLQFFGDNPEALNVLLNGQARLVPHTQITFGGGNGARPDGGLTGAAAVFGSLLRSFDPKPLPSHDNAVPAPVVQKDPVAQNE